MTLSDLTNGRWPDLLADLAGLVLRLNLHCLRLAHELLAEFGNAFRVSG
jgi:hypothetical protein